MKMPDVPGDIFWPLYDVEKGTGLRTLRCLAVMQLKTGKLKPEEETINGTA